MIELSREELLENISDNAECIEEYILYIDDNTCHLFEHIRNKMFIPTNNYFIYYNVINKEVLWDDMIKTKDILSLIYIKG